MFRSLSTAVLLLLFALPGVALAQGTGTLTGVIVDAQSGQTLIGANVRIEGTSLGAATNIDGEYRVIGVPVGTYSVTASYTGYQPVTVEDVAINNGYTRELPFSLSGAELGEVVVEYERPIIQRDAIGTPRVVSGEDLENLPIRSVAGVTALQGGVVSADNTSDLNIRGGRSEEVAYFVDGVRVTGLLGVNQQAVQEQEVLIGTIPARYGDVQSGVISITTKTGRQDFFGAAEFVTSEGLDSYGYTLGSLSLGGPIVPGRVGFFLSGEYNFAADSSPYGTDVYSLSDDAYNDLQAAPQALQFRGADGTTDYIPFPVDLFTSGTLGAGVTADSLQGILLANGTLEEGSVLLGGFPVDRAETFTADRFDISRGKDDPQRDLTLNGSLNFDFGNVNLRLGGGLATRRAEEFIFSNSLYNRNAFYNDERDSYRLYGTFRQRISNSAFFQIQGEFQDFQYVQYPENFSSNIEDVLNYGNIDDPTNSVAGLYYVANVPNADGELTYTQQFNEDGGTRPVRVQPGTFGLPGRVNVTNFQQSHDQRYRFSGNATTQLSVHQIEFGGEYQQDTERFFSLNAYDLARLVNDEDGNEQQVAGFPDGVSSYNELPFSSLRTRIASRYGYNYLGTEEVNDQDIDGYFPSDTGERTNTNIDAYRPRYYAGYIQDKIEFRDLIVQLGFRVDVFDNNSLVLRDIYAAVPIQRADALDSVPAGIESDYAVYYSGNTVVGYRDTDGQFYDDEGSQTSVDAIIEGARGQVREIDAPMSTLFEEYTPQVTFMPRVGVSFPVTDQALFFASYNVTSQRPTERAFAPISTYEELSSQNSRTPNPTLEPEVTTQYELGFRQRVGERAAISLSGFYRTQENKISNRRLDGGFPAYGTYLNADFTTTQGGEVNFDLRRTNNLSINANYTLSFAQGTGSDAEATNVIVWRGDYFPQFLSPANFDQRHTANVTLDYRFGAGEGPMIGGVRALENFGINLIGQFGSGLRYTRLQPNTGFSINDSFSSDVDGTLNGATLPGTTRIDMRIDRAFNLGFSESKLRTYLSVINLLDTENVLAVYRGTGLPNEDGYVNTTAGQTALNTPGKLFNYEAYSGGPINVGGSQSSGAGLFYGSPRQIRLGFLFDF